MSLKEKERRKEQQDKFQAILSALLKDEDNKYCVDCDAKGPRWASWNLGIFLCIRCAGIHRNLGVHISRVKSVNLDTWTPEQVAMMQEIGNSRARAAYEANVPDGYRRPQTDSALESFIRAKYEHKKYVAREWVPPQPKVPKEWLEDKTEKKKTKPKPTSSLQLSSIAKSSSAPTENSKPQQMSQKSETRVAAPSETKVNSLSNDLLGLDLGPTQTNVQKPPQNPAPSGGNNDLLELFGSSKPTQSAPNAATQQAPIQNSTAAVNGSASEGNLFGDDASTGENKTSTKDSIMALFGQSSVQPQMYGVPGGMYIPQNQQQFPGMMVGQPQQGMMVQQTPEMMGQSQGMMGQQPGMMGQSQGMMGTQQNMMAGPQQQMMGMMGQQQGVMGQQQGMMGQQQGMMGQQQGMMGQPQGMMGQPQGMMGQPQGMMGQPGANMMGNAMMNGSQQSAGMFNNQGMMMGNTGMYTPQQMQQIQYQQMQQKMSQSQGTTNWGNPTGQTLSNNLWQ